MLGNDMNKLNTNVLRFISCIYQAAPNSSSSLRNTQYTGLHKPKNLNIKLMEVHSVSACKVIYVIQIDSQCSFNLQLFVFAVIR